MALAFISEVNARNVVGNPSFEFLWDWQVRERLNMWDVEAADPERLIIGQGPSHSGTMSLRLGPIINAKRFQSVWVTQYIPNVNIPKLDGRPLLKVVYWARRGAGGGGQGKGKPDRGKQAKGKDEGGKDKEAEGKDGGGKSAKGKLTAHVDVMYKDSSHLLAVLPATKLLDEENVTTDEEDNRFVRTCHVIPAYGEIRALGIHMTLEDESTEPVYIDDITIDVVETVDDDSCPLYTETFPKRRNVMAHFLAPTVPFTNRSITLATQMTFDRFTNLAATAKVWNGPISAALLMLREGKQSIQQQMKELTQKYYASKFLSHYVAIHLILQDDLNEEDSSRYPVNFLRNVALKFASTSHVFFVDADISPGFSERQAWGWMVKTKFEFRSEENRNCLKCAFIAPVFNVKVKDAVLPVSKKELLVKLEEEKDNFSSFNGVSHKMVNYGKWRTQNKPYDVTHYEHQEPYFIVPREAPLMNDLFQGYGRDKTVYIKELERLRYTFIVLAESFLLNKLDPVGTKTIMSRSRGMELRVFLSIELHWRDLLDGAFSTTRDNFLPQQKQIIVVTNRTKCLSPEKWVTEEAIQRVVEKDEPDGGISCYIDTYIENIIRQAELPIRLYQQPDGKLRKDVLVEKMMHEFRIGLFIEYPKTLTGTIRLMFPIMHPDAAITLIPNNDVEKYLVDGPFQVYKSPKNVSAMLEVVRKHHKGPAIISVNTDDVKDITTQKLYEYIFAALISATDRDIVIFQGYHPALGDVHKHMCELHPNWKIYHKHGSNVYVLKSAALIKNLPRDPVMPPQLVLSTERPECSPEHTKVDIILMTRNRPLQTYAFLDSLRKYVSNVHKIWVLYRADEDLFKDGYDLAISCAGRSLPIEGVRDFPGEFGSKVLDIAQRSEAQYFVLGVDEMIWLMHVDLQYSACLLKKGEGAFHTFQLRLGKSTGSYPTDQDTLDKRFFPMAHNSSVFAYYPLRLEHDFGYVLNVDGTMVSKTDFLEDLGDSLSKHKHPGDLENGWVYKKSHIRSKQWHLMYDRSNVVNNNMYDGRVAAHSQNISEKMYANAKKFANDKQKLDIIRFSTAYRDPKATHINQRVTYVPIDC